MLDALWNRTSALLAAFVAFGLLLLAIPALADAATVSLRVEATSGPLVPRIAVTLPSAAVAPGGAAADQICPGNSVVGAVHTATGGNWSGTWSDQSGWSIERIGTVDLSATTARRWIAYVNGQFVNEPVCQKSLVEGDTLLMFPICITGTSQCFTGGPLQLIAPESIGPGAPLGVEVWEVNTTFDNQGIGHSQRVPSTQTAVVGPDGSATTDQYYGKATLSISTKGPSLVAASKFGRAPDRATVCVTDGGDGYCGTSVAPPVPFDPLAFCTTTGLDGYCGSPDRVAPVGHVTQPAQAKIFPKTGRPRFLRGTVDFDPSQIAQVNLRLMRRATITVTKVKMRRVTVKKRIHGKIVRKRVLQKRSVRVKKKACLGWNVKTSGWPILKKCDVSTAAVFKADGDEIWSYEFLTALPPGPYTLAAVAQDGAGNTDLTPELGRNRITFTVK